MLCRVWSPALVQQLWRRACLTIAGRPHVQPCGPAMSKGSDCSLQACKVRVPFKAVCALQDAVSPCSSIRASFLHPLGSEAHGQGLPKKRTLRFRHASSIAHIQVAQSARAPRRSKALQNGLVGLGRMDDGMAGRLLRAGHARVVFDKQPSPVGRLVKEGALGVASLQELVARLSWPRVLWLMVPAAWIDLLLSELVPLLEASDIVVEGGNSNYCDDIRRAAELHAADIQYLDVGASGLMAANAEALNILRNGR